VSDLPFDLNSPPTKPPASCQDHLMWSLAVQLVRDHRPDRDGFCVTCIPSEFAPCIGRFLATRGLLTACGLPDPVAAGEPQ
jgi:hypothetical protein